MKKKIILTGLGLTALTFLGAGCVSTEVAETTNASVEAENINTVVGSEATTETVNQNTNSETGISNNEEATSVADENTEIDTSDWQTYSNDEYGFSFKYPQDWYLNQNNTKSIGVLVENINDLPIDEKIAPRSSASPVTQAQNESERLHLAGT